MKKSLTAYASALAKSDIDVLEELIGKKYRKFVKFFNVIKSQSDDIEELDYEVSDNDTLSIKVTCKSKISSDVKKSLDDEMSKVNYGVECEVSGKKMKVKIKAKE